MSACIVHANFGSGLLSLFNNVVACLEIYEKVEVRWAPNHTPYKATTQENLWDAIAEPIDQCTVADNPIISSSYIPTYTGVNAGFCYLRDDGWREKLHGLFQRIKLKNCIETVLASEVHPERLTDSIGILHRSSAPIAAEQITGRNPSITNVIRAANRISSTSEVFVACDSIQAYCEFRAAFGNRMYTFTSIGHSRAGGEIHIERQLGESHVRAVMAQTIALSRCRHMVHGVSNIATAAMYMNPQMVTSFLQG